MPSVVFVSRFEPQLVGHGGHHRAYQVLYDLAGVVGKESIISITRADWKDLRPVRRPGTVQRFARRLGRSLASLAEHPNLAYAAFSTRYYLGPSLLPDYEHLLQKTPKPALCIIEDFAFADLMEINARYSVQTIACFQNLEAFDKMDRQPFNTGLGRAMTDFMNEFQVLEQCSERFFISKVEAGLVGGLGLSSHYYPYYPVGTVREELDHIRQERARGQIEPGLLLMIGSASHPTTRESFKWLLEKIDGGGLPTNCRLVVGGSLTDSLLPTGKQIAGVDIRGWLSPAELNGLLTRATAVLIPQTTGFGALTRLAEMACAGISVIVSRHATYALDLPPGVISVDDNWDDWKSAIESVSHNYLVDTSLNAYTDWERSQPRTLQTVVSSTLGLNVA